MRQSDWTSTTRKPVHTTCREFAVATPSQKWSFAENAIGDGTRQVERLMRITRLGEGVDATGRLRDDAIERVRVVLDEYADAR